MRMMETNENREINYLQEPLTERMTIEEAREYTDIPENILPQKCEFCGKKLLPTGFLVNIMGKYRWVHRAGEYELCQCEKAKKKREEERRAEEERLKAEKERAYREKIETMIRESRLGPRFKMRTFANFEVNEKNKEAYEVAKKYAVEFDKYKRQGLGLLFTGGYGTGKTHLAAAICHEIIKQGYQPIFGTMITLLEKIKTTYENEYSRETEERILRKYTDCDLLIIDDLGKERPTDWTLEKLYYVINTRYENCLPIIITTNYTPGKLITRLTVKDNIETPEAIVSRIYEMCKGVYMDWEDYRKY